MSKRLFIGIDTSNYTTSAALCDEAGRVLCNAKLLLPVFTDKVIVNGVEHSFGDFEKQNGCAVINLGAGSYVFEEV